jgi:hypothetical protein
MSLAIYLDHKCSLCAETHINSIQEIVKQLAVLPLLMAVVMPGGADTAIWLLSTAVDQKMFPASSY